MLLGSNTLDGKIHNEPLRYCLSLVFLAMNVERITRELVKMQIFVPGALGQGPRICIYEKLPGDCFFMDHILTVKRGFISHNPSLQNVNMMIITWDISLFYV